MFDFLNTGQLKKLMIEGYDDFDTATGQPTGTPKKFEAFINPDEFSFSYDSRFDSTLTPGQTSSSGTFMNSNPIELSLKFHLDGTKATGIELKNADGLPCDVAVKINDFHNACGYNPEVHKPRYVRILWGSLSLLRVENEVFHGYLKRATFNYKLFDNNGKPLRAIIDATFTEFVPAPVRDSAQQKSSPDLTHIRVVKEGDTLPAMAQAIYGDFNYYLEVAKANGLHDFRNLEPGTKIFFPPFDKNAKNKKALNV